MWEEGVGGRIWCKHHAYMYINGKMRLVETVLGMGVEKTKKNDGGDDSPVKYCKDFYKCCNVPPAQQYKYKITFLQDNFSLVKDRPSLAPKGVGPKLLHFLAKCYCVLFTVLLF
jgi:hypothetical protein